MIDSNKEGNYGAAIRNLAIKFRIEIIETRTKFDSKYNIIGEYLFFYYRSIISQIRIEEK